MILTLYGKPGSGKTHLAERVADLIGWPHLAIDDYGPAGSDRWPRLIHELKAIDGSAIVESNIIPPAYRSVLEESDYFAVQVVAPEAVRRARMKRRGDGNWRSTRRPGLRPDLRATSNEAERVVAAVTGRSQ